MTEDGLGLRDATVAIVGLGLMGGSLALALREKKLCRKIIGVDHNPATLARAVELGIETQTQLDGLAQADLIFLATPVRVIIELLPRVGAIAKSNALVMDLGSTKRDITQTMNALPAHLQAIGAHPMCGKETAGLRAAEAELFREAVFVLTPLARTTAKTLEFAQALAQTIGARPLIMDAERHDKIVATISHLPYALAATLMLIANERARDDDLLFALAASGFRDTSRLAASDTTMMLDILMTNRANVAELLRASARQNERLANLVDDGNAIALRAVIENAASQRRTLFKPRA